MHSQTKSLISHNKNFCWKQQVIKQENLYFYDVLTSISMMYGFLKNLVYLKLKNKFSILAPF